MPTTTNPVRDTWTDLDAIAAQQIAERLSRESGWGKQSLSPPSPAAPSPAALRAAASHYADGFAEGLREAARVLAAERDALQKACAALPQQDSSRRWQLAQLVGIANRLRAAVLRRAAAGTGGAR